MPLLSYLAAGFFERWKVAKICTFLGFGQSRLSVGFVVNCCFAIVLFRKEVDVTPGLGVMAVQFSRGGFNILSHRTVAVQKIFDGNEIRGLEQNAETKSRWAQMARSGKKVMQFLGEGRYIANVADGKVTLYGGRAGAHR